MNYRGYDLYSQMNPYMHSIVVGPFFPIALAVLIISLVLSGLALWRSARNGQKVWFIIFLLVHTLGILEAIYLVWFQKKIEEPQPEVADSTIE